MPFCFHHKPALFIAVSSISFSKPLLKEENSCTYLTYILGLFKQKHPGKMGNLPPLQALPAPRVLEKPGPLAAAPPSMAPPSLPGRQTEGQSRGLPVVGRACQNDRPFRWLKYLFSHWVEIYHPWNLNPESFFGTGPRPVAENPPATTKPANQWTKENWIVYPDVVY